jgi:hypothetical protein
MRREERREHRKAEWKRASDRRDVFTASSSLSPRLPLVGNDLAFFLFRDTDSVAVAVLLHSVEEQVQQGLGT